MVKHSTQPILLEKLFALLAAHRQAFGQERIYWRVVGLVLGEVFNFGRHTLTQVLMVLGITDGDWSGWYRLFSQRRYEAERVAKIFFRETVQHTSSAEPYGVGADGVQIPRSSLRMPGTSWMKAPRTPVFKVGIHRAQRFVHGAWLTPIEAGYSRAIPLRFLPAFPPKAKPAGIAAQTEGEAGLAFLQWTRQSLDEEGRGHQLLLTLADGAFDTLNFWRGLPERTVLAVRTARNRRLYYLPQRHVGPGRPANYGALAPHPWEWLHKHIAWQKREIPVRGKTILMKFQVLGPFVREGLPDLPLFLFVVKGMHRKVGKRKLRWKHRKPSFYLVNAIQVNGEWQLPLPLETILTWLWQRWELEVAHREMKSGFGVGEKQCWNPSATISSVQWNVWVYALLLLSAYRTWGLLHAPPIPTRWWHGAQRWSFNTLWRQFRAAFWSTPQFSSLLDTNPQQLAQKGIVPHGSVQFHRRLYSHLTQKGHLRTLFAASPISSTLLKQPKSRDSPRHLLVAPRRHASGAGVTPRKAGRSHRDMSFLILDTPVGSKRIVFMQDADILPLWLLMHGGEGSSSYRRSLWSDWASCLHA